MNEAAGAVALDIAKWREVFEAHDHALRPFLPHTGRIIQPLINAAAALATAQQNAIALPAQYASLAPAPQESATSAGESTTGTANKTLADNASATDSSSVDDEAAEAAAHIDTETAE